MTRLDASQDRGPTRRRFALLSLLLAAGLVVAPLAAPAAAQSLDELRASGRIGERFDGFAEARDSALADQVAEINAKRRAIYQEQASKQGVSVEQVGKVYAGEIIKQLPSGAWILTADGQWRQK